MDGSDAIADWPILNALINASAGAHWVSVHHGGGVGIGYSIHAGMVVVADGTENARERLERVLTSDPGTGVIRHADAGYERALEVAAERGVRVPMRETRRGAGAGYPTSPRSWRRILRRARTGSTEGSSGSVAEETLPTRLLGGCASRCVPWYRGVALPPCRSGWGER